LILITKYLYEKVQTVLLHVKFTTKRGM